MRRTPKRTRKAARKGFVFPSKALSDNVRAYRRIRNLRQDQVGERMSRLGLGWNAGTCGFVERGDRSVNIDELVGLAVVFEIPIAHLLDPRGPEGLLDRGWDLGAGGLEAGDSHLLARNRGHARLTAKGVEFVIDPGSHEAGASELAALLTASGVGVPAPEPPTPRKTARKRSQ